MATPSALFARHVQNSVRSDLFIERPIPTTLLLFVFQPRKLSGLKNKKEITRGVVRSINRPSLTGFSPDGLLHLRKSPGNLDDPDRHIYRNKPCIRAGSWHIGGALASLLIPRPEN